MRQIFFLLPSVFGTTRLDHPIDRDFLEIFSAGPNESTLRFLKEFLRYNAL